MSKPSSKPVKHGKNNDEKRVRVCLSHPVLRNCIQVVAKARDQASKIDNLAKFESTDVKFDPKVLKLGIDRQVHMARDAMARVSGNRPLVIKLPISVTMSVATSGVLAAALPIDVTASTEFTSLAALFDEYKLLSGDIRFNVTAYNTGVGTTADADKGMMVMGYDPAEGSPLTSVRNGCELSHHALYGSMATNGSAAVQFSTAAGHPHRFSFYPPKGVLAAINSNVQYLAADEWVPTTSSQTNLYWGYLKTYFQTSYSGTTQNALVGILTLDVAFRCRT